MIHRHRLESERVYQFQHEQGHQYYVAYLRLARYSRTGLERSGSSQENVYTTWFRGNGK